MALFFLAYDHDLELLEAVGSSLLMLEEISFVFGFSKSQREIRGFKLFSRPNDIISAILPLQRLVRLAVFGHEGTAHWCGDAWALL